MSKYLFIIGIMIITITLNIVFKKSFKENFDIVTMSRDDANNVIEKTVTSSLTSKQKNFAIYEKEQDIQDHYTKLKNKHKQIKDTTLAKDQLQSWSSWDPLKIHKVASPEKAGSYDQKTNNVLWPIHKESCGPTKELVGCEKNERKQLENPEYLNETNYSTYQEVDKAHSTCFPWPLKQQGCIDNRSCTKCENGKAKA